MLGDVRLDERSAGAGEAISRRVTDAVYAALTDRLCESLKADPAAALPLTMGACRPR